MRTTLPSLLASALLATLARNAAADATIESRLAAEPLWTLRVPSGALVPVWLAHRGGRPMLAGCSEPACTGALQFRADGFTVEPEDGPPLGFTLQDAATPIFRAGSDSRWLMPHWIVPSGRAHGGH